MHVAPDAANSEQMKALVQSVKKNISDIRSLLESMEKQVQSGQGATTTAPAMIKKLRNEITKEEVCLCRCRCRCFDSLLSAVMSHCSLSTLQSNSSFTYKHIHIQYILIKFIIM